MEALEQRIRQAVTDLRDRLVDVSLQIHAHPEPAFEEVFAAKLVADAARDLGFQVTAPVGGLATAFVARHPKRSPGPVVAFLAEYDALPGLGHACGHNLIAAASLGAAAACAAVKGELPGELRLIGTPAEEGGSGKVVLIEGGVFDDVDVALMFHPDSVNTVDDTSLAIREFTFVFHGRAAHASSCPEKGVNALDACIHTFVTLNALRQHVRSDARIHGIITKGGERPNIVPELAEAQFYVRAADDEYLAELVERVLDCARGAAQTAGATVEITEGPSCKAMAPDPALVAIFRDAMESCGVPLDCREGEMGSTDMGDVSQAVRGIHPYLSIVPRGTVVDFHSHELAAAAASELAQETMLTAATCLALTALRVWQRPDEFTTTRGQGGGRRRR